MLFLKSKSKLEPKINTEPNEAIRNCSAKKKIIVTKAANMIMRLVLDFRLANWFKDELEQKIEYNRIG